MVENTSLIYIMLCHYQTVLKTGFTSVKDKKTSKRYCTATGKRVNLFLFKIPNQKITLAVEKELHLKLKDYNASGEMYKLEYIDEILNILCNSNIGILHEYNKKEYQCDNNPLYLFSIKKVRKKCDERYYSVSKEEQIKKIKCTEEKLENVKEEVENSKKELENVKKELESVKKNIHFDTIDKWLSTFSWKDPRIQSNICIIKKQRRVKSSDLYKYYLSHVSINYISHKKFTQCVQKKFKKIRSNGFSYFIID